MQPPPIPSSNPYAAPQAAVSDVWLQQGANAPVNAGFWLRFVALIIDSFIFMVVLFAVALVAGMVLGLAMGGRGAAAKDLELFGNVIGFGLGLIIPWLYYALCEASSWQATPGKKALGLRVTDLTGRPIGFGRASGRHWGKMVSYLILYFGFFMAGWTERKQGLHDMMAGTLVVRG